MPESCYPVAPIPSATLVSQQFSSDTNPSITMRLAPRIKIAYIVLLATVLPEVVMAVSIANNANAFKGYIMEAPISQYPFLKILNVASSDLVQELGLYENPGEYLTLNGVSFRKVRYRFADRRLESIQLVYEGRENREKLLQWLEEEYGRLSRAERKMINQVEWHGDQLAITLSYDNESKEGHLWFISPSLHRLVNEGIGAMPD
jgi:hypothetical protein